MNSEMENKVESVSAAIRTILIWLENGMVDTNKIIGLLGYCKVVLNKELLPLFSQPNTKGHVIDLCNNLFEVWLSSILNRKFKIDLENIKKLLSLRTFYLQCAVVAGRDRPINISVLTTTDKLVKHLLIQRNKDLSQEEVDSILSCNSPMKAYLALALTEVITPNVDDEVVIHKAYRKIKLTHLPYNMWTVYNVSTAYMHVSYQQPDDLEAVFKPRVNEWFRKGHKINNVKVKNNVVLNSEKPVAAVVVERMTSKHAMYRWYEPLITALKEEYYTILVSPSECVDNTVKGLFDEYIDCKDNILNPQNLLDKVTPDLVYFPSVGMSPWAVSLSNIQWGRTQIMSLGHPSQTYSGCIQGIIMKGDCAEHYSLFGDVKCPIINAGKMAVEEVVLHPEFVLLDGIEKPKDRIRIALPSNYIKLTGVFLETLQVVQEKFGDKVEFVFFPNTNGVHLHALEQEFQYTLNNFTVAPSNNYALYLKELASCHFAIGSRPFGSATSIVDCICAGIPIIGVSGNRLCSSTDITTSRYFEGINYGFYPSAHCLPSHTVCRYVEDFIYNQDILKERSKEAVKARNRILENRGKPDMGEFLRAIKELRLDKK